LGESEFDKGRALALHNELQTLESMLETFRIDAEALIRLDERPFLVWNADE
jgi:hypothetical protein